MRVNVRHANRIFSLPENRLQKGITGGRDHGWKRQKERKLQRRCPGHSGQLSSRDCRHGPRCAWKDRRENLANADPDRLALAHVLHVPCVNARSSSAQPCCFRLGIQLVHNPHDDPTNQQRASDDEGAFEVLTDDFDQQ